MKNLIFYIILVLLISLVGPLLLRPRLARNPSRRQIEAYLNKLTAAKLPPGVSAAIVKDGQLVYEAAFGFADEPMQMPASSETTYHWWSMTKVPTALAVLRLSEQGRLDLDASVSDYLPFFSVELDGTPASITIRQLLRHTSGLQDTTPAMIGWVHYEDELYDQTALVRKYLPEYNQLKFAPDAKSAYSNLGYMVLGAVIESVSGLTYEAYIKAEILAPLEMDETDFLYTESLADYAAAGSHPIVSIYTPLLPSLLDMKDLVRERQGGTLWFNPVYLDVTPSSGLIGTARDAAKLANALLQEHAVIGPETHMLLLPAGNSSTGRPLGWAQFNDGERLWVQHRGGGPGFATIMRLYPGEKLGIVLMANSTNLPAEKLVDAFAGLDW